MRALGFPHRRFPLRSGEDKRRRSNSLSLRPAELLLVCEAATPGPALLSGSAATRALLARKPFLCIARCGGIRQRDPRTGQKLLGNEQPGRQPLEVLYAERDHGPILRRKILESQDPHGSATPADYFTANIIDQFDEHAYRGHP